MSHKPLVSVCVPTYNYARFIRKCIDSVRAQTLGDWELLVVDDCSTDETGELVISYTTLDSRIRYIRNSRRLGMNANIRRAADSGSGRYLKILCSDDWLEPRCLEVLTHLMDCNPNVVLGTSAEIACDDVGRPLGIQFLFGKPISVIPGEKMLDRMASGEGFGGNSSFMVRAQAYRTVGGYDETRPYAADYDLAARLCRIGDYLHTDEPLFYGRSHPNSSSAVDPQKLLDVLDWFLIPDKIFKPRTLGDREWRRYNRLTAQLTARYIFNIVLSCFRGRLAYARALSGVLLSYGNFLFGVPFLIFHIPNRLYKRIKYGFL